jgi:hypothetical protein
VKTPEEMWERFIEHLNEVEPLGKAGKHSNFLGSISAYKKRFLEANSPAQELSEEKIVWGLDCNLEDPSDVEARAFTLGVRFAEWQHGITKDPA